MTRPMQEFINNLSTWYVRRSRNRIGPTAQNGPDKNSCYQTLYFVLVTFCKLLAPFAPFISEEIYRNLTGEDSVHLSDWPRIDEKVINNQLEDEMDRVRQIVEKAHAQRKKADKKVRQPLPRLEYPKPKLPNDLEILVAEEVNVKEVIATTKVSTVVIQTTLTKQLEEEGKAREIVRTIQQARKEAGCQLDQKIAVALPSWPKGFEEYIKKETLAKSLIKGEKLKIIK